MKVQILGSGCKKCQDLYANAEKAINKMGLDAELVKIQNVTEIVAMGVLMTPGIAVDGKVLANGRVFNEDEIVKMLEKL